MEWNPFARYMYDLLPHFFKKKPPEESTVVEVLQAFGASFTEVRDTIYLMRRSWFPQKSSLAALRIIAAGRGLQQLAHESVSAFRARVVNAFELYQKVGRKDGVELGISLAFVDLTFELRDDILEGWILGESLLGVDTDLHASSNDYTFRVILHDELTAEEMTVLHAIIKRLKPSHTQYIVLQADELE